MKRIAAMLVAACAFPAPAVAEVRSSGPSGFELEHRTDTRLESAQLYRLVTDIGRWWSSDHTYSGNAANLSLAVQPGGCWCEKLPNGGGVEHMRVAYVEPGKKLVLTGSLGPLLYEATSGVMQWTVQPREGGGSTLVMNYRVAGFHKGDGARLAPLVDQVLGAQVKSLHKFAEDLAIRR